MCLTMVFSSLSGLAPENVSTFSPFFKNTNVGILEISYRMAKSSHSSTSTWKQNEEKNSWNVGAQFVTQFKENIWKYWNQIRFLIDRLQNAIYEEEKINNWTHLNYDHVCSILLCQFLQNGANYFAWSAPSGKKVNNDQFVASIFDLFFEVSLKIQRVTH